MRGRDGRARFSVAGHDPLLAGRFRRHAALRSSTERASSAIRRRGCLWSVYAFARRDGLLRARASAVMWYHATRHKRGRRSSTWFGHADGFFE
ncbi:hypothetical protein HMPREF0762_00595 [Slackia exigua ATCC 700122]|uniref:Uncharacterized protein n=1 Tax=Slackia exigua (strain ATCC 700122 / DSM 15923 / CIP 105133 / JCM 11022 / KCTC 5966 / S-7) TaxID=649764 RepID=D0WFJ6_SLAES|nr:hypothetical protein HMPREF0762_00595 [Slackia exigua ATCC 700122]